MANETRPVVIRFSGVTKEYKLYKSDRARFKALFSKKVKYKKKKAVNNLTFEVHKGEGVALIGRNGAGKSTILKMITGVSFPTQGEIYVDGKISALLELSSGFDVEANGIENIKLKCSLMGMTDEQIKEVLPSIIEFADIDEYIDQPLRSYSSGMKARLGFAISVNSRPDILIVDEALSVGDKEFRKKCTAKVNEIMSGIVLEKGKMLFDGEINEAIEFYENRS